MSYYLFTGFCTGFGALSGYEPVYQPRLVKLHGGLLRIVHCGQVRSVGLEGRPEVSLRALEIRRVRRVDEPLPVGHVVHEAVLKLVGVLGPDRNPVLASLSNFEIRLHLRIPELPVP